jgi:glycosyltransferase involved in cell wall biosynthesis
MKIALIVQRYGAGIVGGSETLARQYAGFLKSGAEVEILTTCASDHFTWKNDLTPDISEEAGIRIRRFPVDYPRGRTWEQLYGLLMESAPMPDFLESFAVKDAHAARLARWPRALQEEIIRRQGPYSTPLLEYLQTNARRYDAFLFLSYLYPTCYFGMERVPCERVWFVPTLHDEPIAYLPVYRRLFDNACAVLFLTRTERALARRLYHFQGKEHVVGMAVPTPRVAEVPPGTPHKYVLFAGRIEGGKGTSTLFDYFRAFKERYPSDCKLVLIGRQGSSLPTDADIVSLGFVSEAAKFALMKGACALIHPSPFESFAIVLLECFAVGTPALVNGRNEVLKEHATASGAALAYESQEEFIQKLWRLTVDPRFGAIMGERGKQYVNERYDPEVVAGRVQQAIGRIADWEKVACESKATIAWL